MMTGGAPRPPSLTRCLGWLGSDDDHRIQTLIRSPRMTQVSTIMSTIMSTVMSAVAGKGILPLRFCAPVATGALCFGGRHKDGKGKGKEDPHQEDGHTPDVAHCIPSFLHCVPSAWLHMVSCGCHTGTWTPLERCPQLHRPPRQSLYQKY